MKKQKKTSNKKNILTPKKLRLTESDRISLMEKCNKWLDEMEALDEEQFKVQFDTENPVVLDFTEVLNSDE